MSQMSGRGNPLHILNERVAEAILAELDNPRITLERELAATADSRTIIAGLVAESDSLREQALETARRTRVEELLAYDRRQTDGLKRLATHGITPIATVPTKLWHKLCKDRGLIALYPNDAGEVHVSKQVIERISKESTEYVHKKTGRWILASTAVAGVAAYLGTTIGLGFDYIGLGSIFWSGVAMIAAGTTAVCQFTSDGNDSWLSHYLIRTRIRNRLEQISLSGHDALCHRLFPDGHSLKKWNGGITIPIALPTPPSDVQDVLVRAKHKAELPIYVVAEPGAIVFPRNPMSDIGTAIAAFRERQEANDRAAIERARALARNPDPIVAWDDTEDGTGCTFVLAQFGDFKLEQELIETLVNSDYLI